MIAREVKLSLQDILTVILEPIPKVTWLVTIPVKVH